MESNFTRRSFIKATVAMGAASFIGGAPVQHFLKQTALVHAGQPLDLSAVKGENPFTSTSKAVEQLGGMEKFVTKGSKVGLLVNSPFRNPGAHVNPDIVLSVISMCYDSGAKEIYSLKEESTDYWDRGTLTKKFQNEIKSLKPCGNYVSVEIKGGKSLKQAQVIKELLECDVFINIPITKDHEGCKFSGSLKNMMGAAPHSTCRFFHIGTNKGGWYNDVDHLNQCIADLNLIRNPDLCVSDSTEFISTNGPSGPGKMRKPQLVVAAADRVLLDSYCCRLLGLEEKRVGMITRAAEYGLGSMDLSKVRIKEMEI